MPRLVTFPSAAHARVADAVSSSADREAHRHFGPSWNGVSQRYSTTCEYMAEFADIVAASGSGAERYREDKALFGAFTAALSVIDCLAYSLFAIGAMVRPEAFDLRTPKLLRQITGTSVLRQFESNFPEDAVTRALSSLQAAPELALGSATRKRGARPAHCDGVRWEARHRDRRRCRGCVH